MVLRLLWPLRALAAVPPARGDDDLSNPAPFAVGDDAVAIVPDGEPLGDNRED